MNFYKKPLHFIFSLFLLCATNAFSEKLPAPGFLNDHQSYCYGGDESNCRPPQLILMAFDGSKSLPMWKETRSFAANNNLRWTFFLSGVHFLTNESGSGSLHYKNYAAPRQRGKASVAGKTNISFARSSEDIFNRLKALSLSYLSGHEIGSHANGHFYGGAPNRWKKDALNWTSNQWNSEFEQFNDFISTAYKTYEEPLNDFLRNYTHLSAREISSNIIKNIKGFRAPQLSINDDLWSAFNRFNFKYDTSKISTRDYWPQKYKNVWNFPLAMIPVPGQSGRITSMDYNMHVKKVSEQNTYQAYMNYYAHNFYGKRAPIHLGHHFTMYGEGRYWRALKRFAVSVCSQPETYCVRYDELESFLESLPEKKLQRFKSGNFKKATLLGAQSLSFQSQMHKIPFLESFSEKFFNFNLVPEDTPLTAEELMEGQKYGCAHDDGEGHSH